MKMTRNSLPNSFYTVEFSSKEIQTGSIPGSEGYQVDTIRVPFEEYAEMLLWMNDDGEVPNWFRKFKQDSCNHSHNIDIIIVS